MGDIAGKFIGILLALFICVIGPFTIVAAEQEMVDRRLIVEDISDFIDTTIDSRAITDVQVREFETKLASYGMILDYDVHRYIRTVNPDPIYHGDYYPTYVEKDDWSHGFDKGDKVSIHVYQVAPSTTGTLAHRLTGLFLRDFDVTITARIR